MSTTLRIGPGEHGRSMTFEEFLGGDYEEGYRYELIDGRLRVSPMPNMPHDWVEQHVFANLLRYMWARPDVVNWVTPKARVFVPGASRPTAPEPDIAAYHDFPVDRMPHVDWRDTSPMLVVEVAGPGSDKDFERNVELYLAVPTIEEYWVFDVRDDPAAPTMTAHRRRGDEWDVVELAADESYTTDLLSGFELAVRPSR